MKQNISNMKDNDTRNVRHPAVSGTFYPDNAEELKEMVDGFYVSCSNEEKPHGKVQAVIVPHAGYVFSGYTAAKAFARISSDCKYKRVFLIGPSHHVAFNGASVNDTANSYSTPLGEIAVDRTVGEKIIASDSFFRFYDKAHDKEHCLEVELPFLQRRMESMPPIVPIIIGTQDGRILFRIAKALQPYFTSDNLFVISSDFSHYPSYENAEKADARTGKAIVSGSLEEFVDSLEQNDSEHIENLCTSACGQCAIAVLLMMMEQRHDLVVHHLYYCNSGDSQFGGKNQVVGYHAFSVEKEATDVGNNSHMKFSLTDKEKKTLIGIARRKIENELTGKSSPLFAEGDITPTLKMHCGAFVTLHENGRLRGCIGNLESHRELFRVIEDMAHSAAFCDPRFYPLSLGELSQTDIEISVLSPLHRIDSIDQFRLGRDGIYMEKDGHSGTFLPQVADEVNWTKEEFLGHCSQDKAGLGWDGWKTARLYTYEAVVFGEKE